MKWIAISASRGPGCVGVAISRSVAATLATRAGGRVGTPAPHAPADIESFRKTIEPIFMTRSRRHDAGHGGVRDVPHLADEPAVRSRDAGHRRRMDRRTVAHELRDDHASW